MNDSMSWAQGSRCYEQLRAMDDINNSGFTELKTLDVINNSSLYMIWMIMGYNIKALNAMNS